MDALDETWEEAANVPPPAYIPQSAPAPRTSPHSPEAEEQVIACCLMDDGSTIDRALSDGLTASSFYLAPNRVLFQSIREIHESRLGLTVETLFSHLQSRRLLEGIGGPVRLMEISGKAPTTAHAGYFIQRLREDEAKRAILNTAMEAVEAIHHGQSAEEVSIKLRATQESTTSKAAVRAQLSATAYSHDRQLPKPPSVISLADTIVSTPGNLTTIYSPPKAGKTAAIGAIIASSMTLPGALNDNLGFIAPNPDGHALLHFDTEQSPYHRQQLINTALKRSRSDTPPPWLHSHLITGCTPAQAKAMLEELIVQAVNKHKGLFAILLDGVGDFVSSPNNEEECNAFVSYLHGTAIAHNCPVICILHLNPSPIKAQADAKGRGHLGSQLERKSESNLILEKSADDVTVIYSTKQRGKGISKSTGPCFHYDTTQGMHVSCPNSGDSPASKSGPKNKYQISDFYSCIPSKDKKHLPLPQIFRQVSAFSSIPRTSFRDLMEREERSGNVSLFMDGTLGPCYRLI